MPTRPNYLGFSPSDWFEQGFASAVAVSLGDGEVIEVFDVLHFLAAKIDAFRDRGGGDLFSSQDFEDITSVLDGNTRVWGLLRGDTAVAQFVADWLQSVDDSELVPAIAGHVNSYERAKRLAERIRALE